MAQRSRPGLWGRPAQTSPLAQIDAREISHRCGRIDYLHTDTMDTPRLATDANQQIVWRWKWDAFGDRQVRVSSTRIEMNLRYPGQYFDAETGLHYNYFRTYDPGTGRYTTSDPLGLRGGLNTFAYVAGNPLRYADVLGLEITGEWDGFNASVTDWQYTGLTAHIERGPGGNDIVDRIGYFNFFVSGNLGAKVRCKETDDCGGVTREWTMNGSVAVNDLAFRVPYDEPAIPIPGMAYAIWADKVWRVSQYMSEWRGMIETFSFRSWSRFWAVSTCPSGEG